MSQRFNTDERLSCIKTYLERDQLYHTSQYFNSLPQASLVLVQGSYLQLQLLESKCMVMLHSFLMSIDTAIPVLSGMQYYGSGVTCRHSECSMI